ncbi:MAG: hypothetical protein IKH57_24780 [Clostridia bacterium]|nr:hypothetical protein [Clostridia bacterium]MBR3107858.1 hypothetical protein [Clostridia bacterium]
MKKIVCFLLTTALLFGCMSMASATLSATYRDGKIYVTNSGNGITRINMNGSSTGYYLGGSNTTVVLTPPAGATSVTITGVPDAAFGGDGGTVTVSIGGGNTPSQPTSAPVNPTSAPTNPPSNPTNAPSTPTNPPAGATVSAGNYANGQLTVYVTGISTPSAIYIDGVPTGVSIENPGSRVVQIPNLAPGTHTVELYTWSGVVSSTFTVSSYAPVTTPPVTGAPAPTPSAHTHSWGEWISVTTPNCENAGEETHTCTICGQTETRRVSPLGHRYVVESENERYIIYRCTNCGKHKQEEKIIYATPTPAPAAYPTQNPNPNGNTGIVSVERNLYGHILYDSLGMLADYSAYSDVQDASTVVIEVDQSTRTGKVSEIGLYMDSSLKNELQNKGYRTVRYINGKAILTISLANVDDNWFTTDEAISYRIFTTDPNYAGGVMVKVEAELATAQSNKIAPDKTLTGIYLKGATDIPIATNGVYDITK